MNLLLAISSLSLTMAVNFDPNISNGTCYYSNDEQADSAYIPCGNDVFGHQSCCQARDVCLSDNACFNGQYGVTYLAGCTDPTYKNSTVCPEKGKWYTQQWVGLVRCFVSNDTSRQDEQWAPCQDKKQPTINIPESCSCNTQSSTAVFTAGPVLTNIASLPVKSGNDIAWYPGFAPATTSTTSSSTSTSTSKSTSSSSTGHQTSTSSSISTTSKSLITPNVTPTASGQTSSSAPPIETSTSASLGTSAKVGIGVGAAGGVVLIAVILTYLAMCYRKRKGKPGTPLAIDQIRHHSPVTPYVYEDKDPEELKSPAWSGHKSELPANESTTNTMNTMDTALTLSTLSSMHSPIRQTGLFQHPIDNDQVPIYRPYSRYADPAFATSRASMVGPDGAQIPRPISTKSPYERAVYEMEG